MSYISVHRGPRKKIAEKISEGFAGKKEYHDILEHRIEKKVNIAEDGLLVLAMPVFGGRIPNIASLQSSIFVE